MADILISSRIFVPEKFIDRDELHNYEIPRYKEATCARCQIYKDGERHSADCDSCPAFMGIDQLWQEKRFKKTDYIALPPGRPARLEKIFKLDLSKAIDLRPELAFNHEIKFTGELYHGQVIGKRQTVDQELIAKKWLKKLGGIIKCPPRTGKTIIATNIICELGLKTIIIANKTRLLQQFLRAIKGGNKRKGFTNINKLKRNSGKKLINIVNKMEDFEGLEIAIVNYQKFIRNSNSIARIKNYINNHFSLLVVDEVHGAGALQYAKFISRLNCKYRLGLSATPERKDGSTRIINEYIGSVIAESDTRELLPEIELVETGITSKYDYKSWIYAMKFLADNNDRKKIIIRQVFKDLRNKHIIIIPVDFIKQGEDLVTLINKQAEYNNDNKNENWPEQTAVFFSASIKDKKIRDSILDNVDKGKYRVLVAIRSMIKEGVDLASPTALYCVTPMSGNNQAGAPLFQQLSYRIATYVHGKQQPIVRLFIDNIPQSFGCFKSLWWKEIIPGLRDPAKYKINKTTFVRAINLAKEREYKPELKNKQIKTKF